MDECDLERSLPTRGAWIEMTLKIITATPTRVAPRQGARIVIDILALLDVIAFCRFLVEGVDRNESDGISGSGQLPHCMCCMKKAFSRGKVFFISWLLFSCNEIHDKINPCIEMHTKILFLILCYEFKKEMKHEGVQEVCGVADSGYV